MGNQRDHLVIRHSRRADHTDDTRHSAGSILRGNDRKVLEPGIPVLVSYTDSNTWLLAPVAEQVAEMLTGFRERDQLTHAVYAREFRLLRKQRRLSEQHIVIAARTGLEKLFPFLDEYVQQLGRIGRRARVAQALGKRCSHFPKGKSGNSLIQHSRHFGYRNVGNFPARLHENRTDRTTRKRQRDEQTFGGKLYEVEPLDLARVEPWPKSNAELLGDDTEALRGASKDGLDC